MIGCVCKTAKYIVTGPAKIGHVGSQSLTTFQTFGFHNFLFQYGTATKFQSLLIIYLASKHCLQTIQLNFSIEIYVLSNKMVHFSPHALFSQARSQFVCGFMHACKEFYLCDGIKTILTHI